MKNNNNQKINEDNIAAIGIGAMIVFIALILVAAVASAVIIQTGEKLQQNAQQSGSDTQREISGKITITSVLVYNDDFFLMYFETSPGSDVIAPDKVMWQMTCEDSATTTYQYVADDFFHDTGGNGVGEDNPADLATATTITPAGLAGSAITTLDPGIGYVIFLDPDPAAAAMGDCTADNVGVNGEITLWIHVEGGGSTYETLYIASDNEGAVLI